MVFRRDDLGDDAIRLARCSECVGGAWTKDARGVQRSLARGHVGFPKVSSIPFSLTVGSCDHRNSSDDDDRRFARDGVSHRMVLWRFNHGALFCDR